MITFCAMDGVEIPPIAIVRTRQWIEAVATAHGKRIGELNYIFVSDEEMLSVNRCYLHHDYYTDIITFDYTESNIISGDMYVSLDTVRSNAAALFTAYEEEFHRVLIHGVLHLCGIRDKGEGERERMEEEENIALAMLLSV